MWLARVEIMGCVQVACQGSGSGIRDQARSVNNLLRQGYAETAKSSRNDSSGVDEPYLKQLQLLNAVRSGAV